MSGPAVHELVAAEVRATLREHARLHEDAALGAKLTDLLQQLARYYVRRDLYDEEFALVLREGPSGFEELLAYFSRVRAQPAREFPVVMAGERQVSGEEG